MTPPADADKTGEGAKKELCAYCGLPLVMEGAFRGTGDGFAHDSCWWRHEANELEKERDAWKARAARMEEALREAKKLPLVRCLRCNGKAEVEEDMLLGGLIMDKIDEALSPKDGR